MIHAKIVSIDSEVALVGSANKDIRSLFVKLELGLWIRDQEFVAKLDLELEKLKAISKPEPLITGPLRESIEGFVGILSPLL